MAAEQGIAKGAEPMIQQTVVRPKRNIARHIEETKTQIKDSHDSWSS